MYIMRPIISDDVLDRLKKFVASKEYKSGGYRDARYVLIERGRSDKWMGMTVDEAISMLLQEAGF